MEKTMEQFVMEYAQNMLEALKDHGCKVDSMNWDCNICPLKDKCHEHGEQNPDDNMTCGQFIRAMVTDGTNYK